MESFKSYLIFLLLKVFTESLNRVVNIPFLKESFTCVNEARCIRETSHSSQMVAVGRHGGTSSITYQHGVSWPALPLPGSFDLWQVRFIICSRDEERRLSQMEHWPGCAVWNLYSFSSGSFKSLHTCRHVLVFVWLIVALWKRGVFSYIYFISIMVSLSRQPIHIWNFKKM